jgi:hypothetical protein
MNKGEVVEVGEPVLLLLRKGLGIRFRGLAEDQRLRPSRNNNNMATMRSDWSRLCICGLVCPAGFRVHYQYKSKAVRERYIANRSLSSEMQTLEGKE